MIPLITLEKKNIHFIGIGGIGMSGLAEYHLRIGNKVSGSDILESAVTERLKKLGAEIKIGHSEKNISSLVNFVVYSSAVKNDNPELLRAHELDIEVIKRAEMLGQIVNDKFLIAVSGTHGKTTTTAMIGKVLVDAGFDPLIFVGGNVSLFDGGASRFGKGNYAVVEADEYDRSFLTLKPDIAIITSIDEDHLDIYKNIDEITKAFKQFCENSKQNSKIIFFGDDENIQDFIHYIKRDKFSYGFGSNNYLKIIDMTFSNEALKFSFLNSTAMYKDIRINLIGKHNALNSAACFLSAKLLKIDLDVFVKSIAEFKTVDRRLELKYCNEISIYDDYAHHPKEIEASLKGLREMFKKKRIISVFQPHLFSRTKDFYKEFASSLGNSDLVYLLDIYPAREKPIEGVSSELIYSELKKNNSKVHYLRSGDNLFDDLNCEVNSGDIVVFQGAGDITLLCDKFIKEFKKTHDINC